MKPVISGFIVSFVRLGQETSLISTNDNFHTIFYTNHNERIPEPAAVNQFNA